MFGVDVTHVQPFEGRRLQVSFSDGVTAVLEMDRVLKHGYAGVFSPLMDEAYFAKFRVDIEPGTIVWPNGADVCPDVLYSHATGEPIVVNGERVLNLVQPGTVGRHQGEKRTSNRQPNSSLCEPSLAKVNASAPVLR